MNSTKCGMIGAALDHEANHVEVPCSHDATHTVYNERLPICGECLHALLDESVLGPDEAATVRPIDGDERS